MSKRDDILWSAVSLMKEVGFEKTSVSQIVRHANVAQGTFYLYFQSKAELVLGIAQHIMDDFMSSLNDLNWNENVSLDYFIHSLVDLTYAHTQKHQALIGFCYSGTAYYNAVSKWDELYIPYYQWLSHKIMYYQNNNLCKSLYPPDALSNLLVGLMEHGAEQEYVFNYGLNTETSSIDVMKDFIKNAMAL